MKNVKKKILVALTICTFAALMILNVSITVSDSNFSVTGLTSLAYGTPGGDVYDEMELEDHTCWETGETILYCTWGSYRCDTADQGSCSDS